MLIYYLITVCMKYSILEYFDWLGFGYCFDLIFINISSFVFTRVGFLRNFLHYWDFLINSRAWILDILSWSLLELVVLLRFHLSITSILPSWFDFLLSTFSISRKSLYSSCLLERSLWEVFWENIYESIGYKIII